MMKLLPLLLAVAVVVHDEQHHMQALAFSATVTSSVTRRTPLSSSLSSASSASASSSASSCRPNANRRHSQSLTFLSVSTSSQRTVQPADQRTTESPLTTSMNTAVTVTTLAMDDTVNDNDTTNNDTNDDEFQKGFMIIGFITLLNASLSPVWHFVFEGAHTPPPLFLNAVVSLTALSGLLMGGPFLDGSVGSGSSALAKTNSNSHAGNDNDNNTQTQTQWSAQSWRGGMELGLWKGLGTYQYHSYQYQS
jgi:hypothetical protein